MFEPLIKVRANDLNKNEKAIRQMYAELTPDDIITGYALKTIISVTEGENIITRENGYVMFRAGSWTETSIIREIFEKLSINSQYIHNKTKKTMMMMMMNVYTEPSKEDIYRRRLHAAERKAKALSGRITMFLADLEKSGLKKADLEKIKVMITVTPKTEKNG